MTTSAKDTMLLERRKALEELHDRVLQMPSKVSYQQMVSLSKVAFCPGKIIHTNEFKIPPQNDPQPNMDKLEFISYIDAAATLKGRLAALDAEIEKKGLQQKSNIAANDAKVPTKPSASNKSIQQPTTVKSSSTKSASAQSEAPKPTTSKARVFEIREYFEGETDSEVANSASSMQGVPMKHEVMDITEQIERMEQFTSKPEGKLPGNSYLNDDEAEFLQELAAISAGDAMDMDDECDVESDQYFEYEAVGGKKRVLENMDDMFARIEAQQQRQEELQQRKLAKQQQQAASTTANKTNNSTSKGGWKSGFLSGSNDNNTIKKDKPVSAPTIPNETSNKPLPIRAPSTTNFAQKVEEPSTLPPTPILAESETRRVQFRAENDILEIDNREQLAAKVKEMKIEERKNELATKRAQDIADAEAAIQAEERATGRPRVPPKKPFSGMIMEKFP